MIFALTLTRMRFAFTVSFRVISLAFTAGLASYWMVLKCRGLKAGRSTLQQSF